MTRVNLILTISHDIRWKVHLVPSSSLKRYKAQSRGVSNPLVHARRGEVLESDASVRSDIYLPNTHPKYPRRCFGRSSVCASWSRGSLRAASSCSSSVSLHPSTVCPVSRSQSHNLGKVSLAGILVQRPPWRRSIYGHNCQIRSHPLPSAGGVGDEGPAAIGPKSLVKK